MSIPEQVRRQSEAIAKMYEPAPGGDTPTAPADDASAPPADGGSEPVAEPSVSEQAQPAPAQNDASEQRYRTLQGMYNADTARLRAELSQRDTRLAQLENLLSSMGAARAPQAPQPPAPERIVTPKDMEEYGDSIEVMRRVSREELAAANARVSELEQMIRQLQTNVVPRVEQVAQQQEQNAQQTFWTRISSAIPDWRTVNSDPRFHEWLLTPDALSGLPRQTLLEDAQRKLDVDRVVSFFSAWRSMNGQPPAQSTRDAAVSELDRQVSPGRSRAGSVTSAADKAKTYTAQDISKFFDDVRRGLYRGKEAERDRIERDIFAAQQQGRITRTA
jgi:hypothetical protein